MQINSYFENIRSKILEELSLSTERIQVAVAWFTNHELFDKLCEKVANGITVELIIIDDEINNRIGGLNFQHFIKLGGTLIYSKQENPMHHKFCIVDNYILINGSYNWTYFAENINYENVTIFKGASDILKSFSQEFEEIKATHEKVIIAKQYDINIENFKSVFAAKNYLATDIYQFALEEEKKGNTSNSLSLINLSLNLKPNFDIYIQKRFEIRNVIYTKWNEDYIIDKVVLNDTETILYFRTHIDDGAYIHSPNAKFAWKLRNTQNINQILNCKSIKNIALNGKVLMTELPDISIFSFKNPKTKSNEVEEVKEESISGFNEQGIKMTEDGKAVDEKGRNVKLIQRNFTDNDEMTCEIHFPPISETINFVDLIEGIEAIDKTNHWHCFDIELNRNRVVK